MSQLYTLIGDLVGSRRLPDRAAAQDDLGTALGEVNELLAPVQQLEPTVGDEFQGAFGTLADATLAALLIRLALLPDMDVRCGIGHGDVVVHDSSRAPLLQDGPGWWTARDAVESMRGSERTAYIGEGAGRVNAFLWCRDAIVERLDGRGCRMLRMSLLGRSQQQITEAEGLSKSAVSQRFARGIRAVRNAQTSFGEGGPGAGGGSLAGHDRTV